MKTKAILEGFGTAVRGYRSPAWEFSVNTLELLAAHGIGYSTNLMDRLHPYRHPNGVVELPEPALAFFERYGQMPLPPYIAARRPADDKDVAAAGGVFTSNALARAHLDALVEFDALPGGDRRGRG